MKKLITGALAALALLFGFASCSGDLHDEEMPKHEPVTIDGAAWYYYDITVYGDNDGSSGKFILNGSAGQSVDTTMPKFAAKDGGALYFTADATKKNDGKYELLTSYQTDNPAYTATPGTIRFYIYTNETNCNFYSFDGGNAFTGSAGWPGNAMTKDGEVAKATYDAKATLKSITVTGLPDALNGKEIYLTGEPLSWAAPGKGDSKKVTVSNNKISLADLNIELSVSGVEVGKVGTQEMKFAAAGSTGWAKPEVTAAGGNNFKIIVEDGAEINLVGAYTGTKADSGADAQVYCCVFAQ